jgi:hypothetical protein
MLQMLETQTCRDYTVKSVHIRWDIHIYRFCTYFIKINEYPLNPYFPVTCCIKSVWLMLDYFFTRVSHTITKNATNLKNTCHGWVACTWEGRCLCYWYGSMRGVEWRPFYYSNYDLSADYSSLETRGRKVRPSLYSSASIKIFVAYKNTVTEIHELLAFMNNNSSFSRNYNTVCRSLFNFLSVYIPVVRPPKSHCDNTRVRFEGRVIFF